MTDAPNRGSKEREGFRPDIEGLRAVAVGLVLLYHAAVPGFGGGYIGVDVFFVVSGFLITGLLLRERATTGTISLPAFYARRLRRLLPAVALLIVATVVMSVVVLSPLRASDVAADGVAAALYASNLRFAIQATDYLQSELAPSPLLHLWSLGVEEQFYLFWPALLLLITRGAPDLLRRVGLLAAVVVVSSFGLSLWLTGTNAPWAFFSLPSRAWELGIGAMLAVSAGRLAKLPERLADATGWLGLAMIVAAGLVIETSTPFPGIAALLPTVGTALAMLPGMRSDPPGPMSPAAALSWRPARFLGRISYSLYLWHWPLLVLPTAMAGATLPLPMRVAFMVAAIPIAAASQRWLEDPIRRGRLVGVVPRRNLALAGALSLAVAGTSLGLGFLTTRGLPDASAASDRDANGPLELPNLGGLATTPSPVSSIEATGAPAGSPGVDATLPPPPGGPVPDDLLPPLIEARNDIPEIYGNGCHLSQPDVAIPECAFGDVQSTTTIVLVGDSHAAQWFPALERLAEEHAWRLVSLTKSGCTPAKVAVWNVNFKRAYTECDAWRSAVVQRIAQERPTLVILSSSHPYRLASADGAADPGAPKALADGLASMLRTVLPLATDVALLGDTPKFGVDAPECLSAHLDDVLACAQPRAAVLDASWTATERSVAVDSGATFVDPTDWACPTDPCPAVIGRFLTYHDDHHLATPYVIALRDRLLGALPGLAAP